jgi:sec-independent protein translocase protein TatB
MFNVGGPEVLIILLVALIALGPAQLPEAARKVGKAMNEVRRVSTGFQRELTTAFEVEEKKAKEKPKSAGGPTDVREPVETDEATASTGSPSANGSSGDGEPGPVDDAADDTATA